MAYDAALIADKIERVAMDALTDLEMGRKVDVSIFITNEGVDISQRIAVTGLIPVQPIREMEFAPQQATNEVARDPNEP